jgi:hypothetical protein
MKTARLFLALAAMLPAASHGAATIAADNASDAAYNDGWTTGDNGGSLFGAWTISTSSGNSGQNGVFIGTSANNGTPVSGNIDVSSESFGMYANSSQTVAAVRSFTVGGPNASAVLGLDQFFSLKMDNGNIATGASVGFGLQNSGGTNRLEFYFQGGDSNYTVNLGGTEYDTGIGFTDDGLDISFRQDAANGYQLIVGATTFTQANFQALGGSDISQFRLFNFNSGSGSANDAFFNSFAVTPEPSRAMFLAIGIAGLIFRRRR